MSHRATIAVLEPGYADYRTETGILEPLGAGLVPVPADEDAASAISALDPLAIMVRERIVGRNEIDAAPNLRAVIRYGIGVDNIDLETARTRQVYVANVPDYGAEQEVSDHAVALYLAAARRIVSRDHAMRAGRWSVGQNELVPGHRGATLGLLGYGRIARVAARKFRALGFENVLAHDPAIDVQTAHAGGVELVELDRLCREADLLSLHVPLTVDTRHIIDRERLASMKPTAILVNVARGGLVDETALSLALEKGTLFGAGIDVFENEPPDPSVNPLFRTPNTVLSDHTAWYSESSVRLIQENAAREVVRVLSGEAPLNWLNPW